jgi:hypothetical protein
VLFRYSRREMKHLPGKMYFLFSCHFYCLFFFLSLLLFFFTVPPMCQVVAIVFRLSLSTYFLPPLRTLSIFLCFPLFNRRMHYRVPLSRCLRFQINFVWNSEFRLRIYFRIQKNHIPGYINVIFVGNIHFSSIVHMQLLPFILSFIQFNNKYALVVCRFNQYNTDSTL